MTSVQDEIVDVKSQLCASHYERHSGRHPNIQWPSTSQCLPPSPFPMAWNASVGGIQQQRRLAAELRAGDPHGQLLEQSLSPQPRALPALLHAFWFHSCAIPALVSLPCHVHQSKQCHSDIPGSGPSQTGNFEGQGNNKDCRTVTQQMRRTTPQGHITE